jgi:hypothetical protein
MAAERERMRVTDFYTEVVLPALAERLDQAFPEFGWRRDAHGWVATNEEHTHARLGVRAERVVAHGQAPPGFLIHGGEPTLWTAYVSGGEVPHGEEFVRTVHELAQRARVDPSPIERPAPRDRRAELLEEFIALARRELRGERGEQARAYLDRRGLTVDTLESSGLGLVPTQAHIRETLARARYRETEVAAAGIVADSRWTGRVCGAWRNEHGRIGTLWARTPDDSTAGAARYLYLRGARRSNLPPYGLSDVLAGSRQARRHLVLVEGFFDLHALRAQGVENVAALGGIGIAAGAFERLSRLGVEQVTICLDRDDAGRSAVARAVEQSARADRSPAVFVVDPEQLAPEKDPDAFVRRYGVDAWAALVETRGCGISWRAGELLQGVAPGSAREVRREALARAGRWLGTLPPRLALEQEDAVGAAAERCGYSPAAVERTFRARFWDGVPLRPGLRREVEAAPDL